MLDPKEEIKTRLDIVDLINEYVALKPAGANHKALCPFHTEKTPSFMVSRDRQMWRCFGCSEGGDVFSFIMKMEGLDFPGALRLLANKAGVTLRRHDPQIASHRNTLLGITTAASDWWRRMLLESPLAAGARAYLKTRGIGDTAVETFALGFAPDSWDMTGKYLRERGFSDQHIFEAGLSVKKERGAGFYDRFRNRLIFPVHDTHGQVIGFGGRALPSAKPEEGAKYINTPQTAIYNKGIILYNLHRAKSEIRSVGHAVLVEGYMDALASWEAGVKNVVAVSGTALTQDQIKLLKRFTSDFAIAFDMDPAGAAAAMRGIDLLMAAECSIKVITLPFGKDPDECVRKDPGAWASAVKSAREFMEYCFTKTFEKHPPKTAANKKLAAKTLLNVIGKLGNAVEQSHWLQQLANALEVPEQVLREALPSRRVRAQGETAVLPLRVGERDRGSLLEEQLVALLLYRPMHIAAALQWIGPEHLTDQAHHRIFRQLTVYYNEHYAVPGGGETEMSFQAWLGKTADRAAEVEQVMEALLFRAERDFAGFDQTAIAREITTICTDLRREHLRRQIRAVQAELRQAEQQHRRAEVERLSQKFTELLSQLHLLGA